MTEQHDLTITVAPWTGGYTAAVCTCGAATIDDVDGVLQWTQEHSYLQKRTK